MKNYFNINKITAFIDTSVFFKENFTASRSFHRLLEFAEKKEIDLIITDIVYGEVLSNQAKKVNEAIPKIKKTYNERNKEGGVFRCYDDLSNLFFKPKLEKDSLIAQFKEKFDSIIKKCHIKVINSKETKVGEIFDRYFKKEPPFSEKKKNEFPDAFSLKTVLEFVKSNKIRNFYIVSQDLDYLTEDTKKITVFKEVKELLNECIRKNEESEKLSAIDKMYEEAIENLDYFRNSIEKLFEDHIYSVEYNPDTSNVVESVDDINISGISFLRDYNLLEIEERYAVLETNVRINYTVEYTYLDYSMAHYDKEDDRWYGVDSRKDMINGSQDFRGVLKIDYNPPAGRGLGDIEVIDLDLSKL